MKITDIIRGILDFIDGVDGQSDQTIDYEEENPESELDRMIQLSGCTSQFSNSPNEQITPHEVVFSIGDDVHKPKNPADIRADSFSMFPDWQAKKD